ncbi:Ig-like domain-containing protein [Massilia sp. CFBP9026]|uniref:Ig-like domain-containing protein n=1 Tax=Massilia sp. CFBP9026 TaxID=3096536 RepID=UPI002A6A34EC|nr:Ig-like domain-containing protein [Massilia sp. CFBP9026]MDY0961659.1 Ig-like domain-containing protein [Massilia sp. CFBP9026]
MTSKQQQAALGELFIASTPNPAIDVAVSSQTVPELAIAAARKEIVFIDDQVPDIEVLVRGFGADKEIVILDSGQDGLRQIADALAGRTGIDALHIISHGAEGRIALGSTTIDGANLPANGALLQAIGASLAEGADILLYGCKVGAGAGQALVDQLAIATGADVAASDDLTGNAALGGDWRLEINSGDIETAALVDPALAALYQHTLAISSATIDFSTAANFDSTGTQVYANANANYDVVYNVGGDSNYQLTIDGQTRDVAFYDYGYVGNDVQGKYETMLTFSFGADKVFTPNSIRIANGITQFQAQKLIFQAYDAKGDRVGAPTIFDTVHTGDEVAYVDVSFLNLVGIAKLTLTADESSFGGLMSMLYIDDFVVSDIKLAGPTAPVVTSVSSTNANGAYGVGQDIFVTITFDQAVSVAGGIPTLQLETGATDRLAVYAGGTGSNTLTFKYTVQPGDSSTDLNYFSTGSLSLGGATIKGSNGGADASLVLPALNTADSLGGGKAIVIDTLAPTLAISSNVPGPLKIGQTAVITFTFSEQVNGFERSDVQVSGGTLGNLTDSGNGRSWTATFTPTDGVNNGVASITVEAGRYTDAAGNNGGAGSSPSITFDTLAPGKPAQPVLQAASDTGVVGDNITSDSTPTFSGGAGSVEGLATVRVYAGATLIGQTTANADGSWNATSSALASASYQVTVVASDEAGNASIASNPLSLVIDTVAPGAPTLPVLATGSDSGVKNDNITNAATQTIGGAANSAEGGSVITLYSGGVAIPGASTTANLDGSWSIDLPLAHGSHAITARATDKAGNTGGASPVLALTVDRVAPDQPQAPLLHADSNSGSKADTITNDRTPTFYGETGSVEGGATVKLYADGQPIGSVVAAANGSWSVAANELDNGTYTITAEAVDVAGNVSAASSGTSLTIDFTPPTAGVDNVAFSDDTGVAGDFITRIANQTVSGTLTAPLAGGEWVGVSIDNGVTYSPAVVGAGGDSWSLASVQIEGTGTLWVRVFDAAGNGGTPFSHAYELDTAAPGKPSTPDLTDASDSGDDNQDNITGVTMPTFTGTAEKDATITLYADGQAVGTAKAGADGKWSVTVDEALEGGSYAFTVRATDLAGNQGVASDALDVTIITAAPTTTNLSFSLETDSGLPGDRITNVAAQLLQGELSAALGAGEKVQVRVAGGSWQEATIVTGTTGWTLDTTLAQGAKEVEVQVVNAIGNAGPVESYDYVLDTDAPTVRIESDKPALKADETAIITFTFSDAPGATFTEEAIKVSGGTLSGFDGAGLVWTAVFTPAADTNNGTASISLDGGLFTDLAGNESVAAVPASLTFDTKRPETSAPVLAAASDTGWSAADGVTANPRPTFTGSAESGATVTLYDAMDNVIGSGTAVNGAWSIAPVANLANGKHTISARAVDVNGNASALVPGQEITIDTTPPTVTITSNVDKLKIGETATITFTFSEDPGATFTREDITVVGGTLGALEKDGLTFSATFTPTDDVNATTASITIGAGSYTDRAGNNGGPGIAPTLAFDTRAPGAPSVPDLDPASDTGTSDEDDITGDTTPTFSGTAEAGVTVRLFAGDEEIGSAVATGGVWSITSKVLEQGKYDITAIATDAFGNEGPASDPLKVEIITDAPTTTATSLKFSADTGASNTDLVTRTAAQTISGELDAQLKAGEYVEVSVDGGKHWSRASIDANGWSIAATLVAGEEAVAVRVVNAIGNPGEEYTRDYRLDTLAPGVTITSNVSALKRGESATITFTFSEDPGATFTWNGAAGDVVVSGGALSAISGSGATRTATFTPADGFEGNASITVAASSYADLAGNLGTNGVTPALAIDTKAPDAPAVPKLAADSDTGEKGDGRTESTTQVIEGGGADPGAMVYLYNGNLRIGSAQANADGLWSIDVALGGGTYTLSVTQNDKAGNESAKSDPFQLTVTVSNPEPNPQPNPPAVIDGMPVTTTTVTLPGGVRGTTVAVPIVTSGRNETDGQASLADIPLASSGGQTQLLAQLPVGYGLSSSGASVGATSGLAFLIASIKAATPTHAPDDQGHLVQNGTSFLQGLSYSSLLVHTVKPVSNPGTTDALVLTGFNPSGVQGTALVIETAGLANGASIQLADVDFAALIGAATVYTGSNGAILSGDGASQHFTVLMGNDNGVFAGGGSDLLSIAAGAPVDPGSASGRASAQQAAASGVTTLHGGQGGDAASFAGARADYDIEAHNGYLVVSSKAAPDAKALVVNVEELRFGDGNVAVENGAGLTTLAGMYQTVFGRQADLYGFEFWADHRDHGVSWGTIALELIASSERVAQHGDFNGDAANDIGLLYQALFNRAADAQGLAYWRAAMEERGMSLEQVATSFVESAEMVGFQRAALDWDFQV